MYQQTEITCSWTVTIEPEAHVDLEIRATAVGQMVEPDLPKSLPRRKRTAPAASAGSAAAPADTAGRSKR